MNISLVHLTLAAAFSGPYITTVPASNWQRFTLQSAKMRNFLANALFTTARMTIDIGKSSFKNFQDSAIVLSNAEAFSEEGQKFTETQVQEGGDGVQKGSFTGCVFERCVNSNGDGGAVRSVGFIVSFEQCEFVSCRASGNGGALYVLGSGSGWLGDWGNLATLPSVKINGSTFQGCVGGGSDPGHVIYTQAMQVGIYEFSAENCAESGSSGAVFFLWSNDVLSENGNMSMHETVSGGDVSAFHVMYSGRDGESIGSFTGIPAVNHRFHQVDGFKCEYLYWAHVQNGIGSHVLDFIEVRNIEFVDGGGSPAVFYAYRESSGTGHQLQINYCSVYGVEGNGEFYGVSIEDIKVFVKFCTTSVSEWSRQEGDINITFVEPDSPDVLSSDAEEADLPGTSGDEHGKHNEDGNGLPGGAIAGIVVSVLVIICIVIVVIVLLLVRRRSSSSSSTEEHEMNSDTATVCTVPPVDPAPVTTETHIDHIFDMSDSVAFNERMEEEI